MLIGAAVFAAWLLGISVAFWWLASHYRRLVKGADGKNLKQILDKILAKGKQNEKKIDTLGSQIAKLEKDTGFHIQKVGIVRFNPFSETGGDHSFSLALLDAHDTGLVITGLHTRERTRIYVKLVKGAKSEHELSKEEERAIKKAQK